MKIKILSREINRENYSWEMIFRLDLPMFNKYKIQIQI